MKELIFLATWVQWKQAVTTTLKYYNLLTCDHVSKHVYQIRANIVIDLKLFFCPLCDCKSNLSF